MTENASANPRPITMLAVREIFCDCLGVELDEVTPTANFFFDLGGESIDGIDLGFRLEKVFHIKLGFRALFSDELWQRDDSGRLTPGAREQFRSTLPFLDIEQFEAKTGSLTAQSLFTAEIVHQMLLHSAGNDAPHE